MQKIPFETETFVQLCQLTSPYLDDGWEEDQTPAQIVNDQGNLVWSQFLIKN